MATEKTQTTELFNRETAISEFDKSIYLNFISQIIISILLLIAFLVLRWAFKKIYMRNVIGRPNHPCYNYTGFIDFLRPLFLTNDKDLLLLCGLDSFILLMTLKLFIKIFLILCIMIGIPLCILYGMRITDKSNDQLFFRFSISNIEKNPYILAFPIFLLYVSTFIIIYFIFIQSKKLIALRQAYIRNPASLMGLTTLRINENLFNNRIEDIIRHINMPAKTVLVKNLPPFITNRHELNLFFKNINIGKVKEVVLINPAIKYSSYEKERKRAIQSLERKIEKCFNAPRERTYSKQRSSKEKNRLFNIFMQKHSAELKTEVENLKLKIRPITSTNSSMIKVEQVSMEKEISDNFFNLSEVFLSKKSVDSSFFDIPIVQQHAFVTFQHQRSASIAAQCLLSLSLFQLNCSMAPRPKDVIWKSFSLPIYSKYPLKFLSNFFYFFFCIFFISLAIFIIDMFKMKNRLGNYFSYSILNNLVAFLSGIIGPTIYNILLSLSPYIIYLSIKLKQYNSVSRENMEMLKKNTSFLLYVAILGIFCGTTLVEIMKTTIREYNTNFHLLFKTLDSYTMSIALLFSNTIIQKIFVGSLTILLRFSGLLKLFMKDYTSREKYFSFLPDAVQFDIIYSSILLTLPMILIYIIICPFMLFFGLFYFSIFYIVFKYDFLYSSHNKYETGGKYWDFFSKYLIYVLMLSQTITFLSFMSDEKKIAAPFLLLLIFLTGFFGLPLVNKYSMICKYYPINLLEEQYITKFSSNVLSSHMTQLNNWSDESDNFFHDSILLKELEWEQDRTEHLNLYYDPTVISMYDRLILPIGFYDTIEETY